MACQKYFFNGNLGSMCFLMSADEMFVGLVKVLTILVVNADESFVQFESTYCV